jgi:predicted nuclease of predicted toxin-antitoxin system
LSLALLLDEDSQAKYLVSLLRAAEHDVLTINEIKLTGTSDDEVLKCARQQRRILLTRNCSDFYELHQTTTEHFGILAVYQDADPTKNMSYQAIVNAIANLEFSGLELTGRFIALNQWNY